MPIASLDPAVQQQVEGGPRGLKEQVGAAVVWGFRRGFVHFDAETGLAYAQKPPAELTTPPATPTDATEPSGDVSPEAQEKFSRAVAAWFRERAIEGQAYSDLQYALTLGEGQRVGLSLLGVEIAADSAMHHAAAGEISVPIALLASTEGGVPAPVYERFRDLLEYWANSADGLRVPMWWRVLLWFFDRPLVGETSREVVENLLYQVSRHDRWAPEPFRSREPSHIGRAERFVQSEPFATSQAHDQPVFEFELDHAKRRGRGSKPWNAAVGFAQCFGVPVPAAREKDARRKRLAAQPAPRARKTKTGKVSRGRGRSDRRNSG